MLPGLRAGNKPRFRQLSNNLKIISSKSMMRIWEQIKINSKTILILEMGFLVLKMIVHGASFSSIGLLVRTMVSF